MAATCTERVALWPLAAAVEGIAATSHVIFTPDGDVYEEAAADYSGFRVLDNGADAYPADFVGDDVVIQFMQPISDADLQKEIQAARRSARATVGQRPQARPPAKCLNWQGSEQNMPRQEVADFLAGAIAPGKALERPVRDGARDHASWHRTPIKTADGDFEWIV